MCSYFSCTAQMPRLRSITMLLQINVLFFFKVLLHSDAFDEKILLTIQSPTLCSFHRYSVNAATIAYLNVVVSSFFFFFVSNFLRTACLCNTYTIHIYDSKVFERFFLYALHRMKKQRSIHFCIRNEMH